MNNYQIIRSKRKTISIEVRPDGAVLVRAPLHTPEKQIFAILEDHEASIKKARSRQSAGQPYHPRHFTEGQLFWYLGQQYPLKVVEQNTSGLTFQTDQGFLLSKSHLAEAQALFTAWYRKQTRSLVSEMITRYQKTHHFKVGTLRINSVRSHWGSCSGKNNLNFNFRLSMAQPSAIDYVVLHELAHTRFRNHSTDFWHLVNDLCPGWKGESDYLAKNGVLFSLD